MEDLDQARRQLKLLKLRKKGRASLERQENAERFNSLGRGEREGGKAVEETVVGLKKQTLKSNTESRPSSQTRQAFSTSASSSSTTFSPSPSSTFSTSFNTSCSSSYVSSYSIVSTQRPASTQSVRIQRQEAFQQQLEESKAVVETPERQVLQQHQKRYKDCVVWKCKHCNEECIPVREQSRCLCGHRLKEHPKDPQSGKLKCANGKCNCTNFFFIVAEGAWVLRCNCKHKHIDHCPKTHRCRKANCDCRCFHSPWVCNCDHPWAEHQQLHVKKRVKTLAELCSDAQGGLDLRVGGDNIKRTDLYAKPLGM